MRNYSKIILLIGCIVFGIGFNSLLGYIVGDERAYRWYGLVGMAINTAVAFMFVGLALYLIGKKLLHDEAIG